MEIPITIGLFSSAAFRLSSAVGSSWYILGCRRSVTQGSAAQCLAPELALALGPKSKDFFHPTPP